MLIKSDNNAAVKKLNAGHRLLNVFAIMERSTTWTIRLVWILKNCIRATTCRWRRPTGNGILVFIGKRRAYKSLRIAYSTDKIKKTNNVKLMKIHRRPAIKIPVFSPYKYALSVVRGYRMDPIVLFIIRSTSERVFTVKKLFTPLTSV